MNTTWKTVRIFISSTFRDMHAERDHLVKVVFPSLRERLLPYRLYLVDIDLRWGVTPEQAENDQVLDLCLDEIDRSRPFFIGLLGERYGWVPTHYPVYGKSKQNWIRAHTGRSVTELEILYGVLDNPAMQNRAFFYFRDPACLKDVPEPLRREVYEETEPGPKAFLTMLKDSIRKSGVPVVDPYPVRWDPAAYDLVRQGTGRLVDLEAFGDAVREQLWEAIKIENDLPEIPPNFSDDPLGDERDQQERFAEMRCRIYVPRLNIHADLLHCLGGSSSTRESDPEWDRNAKAGLRFWFWRSFAKRGREMHTPAISGTKPLVVTGPAGSGKSATLAWLCGAVRDRFDLVIPHFVGASPGSTDIRRSLRRWCGELKNAFGFEGGVPHDYSTLVSTFRGWLTSVPEDKRVLLVIDAVNQLDEADNAHLLAWLPTEIPPHVKLIVSCVDDLERNEDLLRNLEARTERVIRIEALTDPERLEVLHVIPSVSAKALSGTQVRLLMENPETRNPLYLLVALEELRGSATFETVDKQIRDLPREEDATTALFERVIVRLKGDFDGGVVRVVLCALACSRSGIAERDLEEMAGGSGVFPVLRQIRPYLQPRGDRVDFFHRQLFKAVRNHYLRSSEDWKAWHGQLAEHYARKGWSYRPSLCELPFHLTSARDTARLEDVLTDIRFLISKCSLVGVYDLLGDFQDAVRTDSLADVSSEFQAVHQVISQSAGLISSNPDSLASQLCVIYPEIFASLVLRVDTAWVRPTVASRNITFFTANRQVSAGAGHPRSPNWVAIDDRGRRIATAGDGDGSVVIWHRDPRMPPLVLSSQETIYNVAAFSPDGRFVAAGGDLGTITVWNTYTGQVVAELEDHQSYVLKLAWSPDGKWLASVGGIPPLGDLLVRIWKATDWTLVERFEGAGFPVRKLQFSPNSLILVTGGKGGGTIHLFDTLRRSSIGFVQLDVDQDIKTLCFHANSRYIYAVTNELVRVSLDDWSVVRSGTLTDEPFSGRVFAEFLDRDETIVVCAGDKANARLRSWIFTEHAVLQYENTVLSAGPLMGLSVSDVPIAVCLGNGTTEFVEIRSGQAVYSIQTHADTERQNLTPLSADISGNGRRVLWPIGQDRLVLFDTDTNEEIRTFQIDSGERHRYDGIYIRTGENGRYWTVNHSILDSEEGVFKEIKVGKHGAQSNNLYISADETLLIRPVLVEQGPGIVDLSPVTGGEFSPISAGVTLVLSFFSQGGTAWDEVIGENRGYPTLTTITTIQLSPSNAFAMLGSNRGQVFLLPTGASDTCAGFAILNSCITSATWSPSGDMVAVGTKDGRVALGRVPPTVNMRQRLEWSSVHHHHGAEVVHLAFVPKTAPRFLVTGDTSRILGAVDIDTGQVKTLLATPSQLIAAKSIGEGIGGLFEDSPRPVHLVLRELSL
jgi:WD40 repeat protein